MGNREASQSACKEYEARWEDYLDGAEEPAAAVELAAHLECCSGCREALEAARLSRELLREVLEPAREPSQGFVARVVGGIRAEESRRLAAGAFWRPLEALASRVALTAAMALLALAMYVYEFAPPPSRGQLATQSEASEGLLDAVSQPASEDEVLLMPAGSNDER